MSMMPILYTPKSPYTTDTNVVVPVLVAFFRAGAILMLDWVSMRFVENAPVAVWIATGVFSVAVLAVLQTQGWLDFKGRWYFTISLSTLLIGWVAVVTYGYWSYPPQGKVIPTFPTADEIGAAIARHLPTAPPAPQPANATDRQPTSDPISTFLHLTDAKRWRLMTILRDSLVNQIPANERCHALLASKPGSSSSALFWNEFAPILNYANWMLEGGANRSAFPDGITIEAAGNKGTGFTCGWKLSELLETMELGPINFRADQTTPSLLQHPEATEIVIGDVTVKR